MMAFRMARFGGGAEVFSSSAKRRGLAAASAKAALPVLKKSRRLICLFMRN
jgi:hypothetical protein